MKRLQIQLILRLLGDQLQVRAQRRFRNPLGVVVVILLPLHERLGVLGRNDAGLKPQLAQHAADEMRTQARFQADDATRQLLECRRQSQPSDLASQDNPAIARKADDVKNVLTDVDADDGQFSWCWAR